MRSAKPWYRKQKKAWCAYVNGSLVTLVNGPKDTDHRKEAQSKLDALLLHASRKVNLRLTLAQVCDLFLEHSLAHHERSTYEQNLYFLQAFCDRSGRLKVRDLKPFHLTTWLDKSGLGDTSRNKAIGTVKRVFNWALEEGHVQGNPFANVKKPKPKRRERILTEEEIEMLFRKVKGRWFRDFLTCLLETGARPSEIAKFSAENLDLDKSVAILWQHKTFKKTGKPRIIYLTPKVIAICKFWLEKYPTGLLFRTLDGNPVTKDVLNCRFRRLREKHPQLQGVTSYVLRHHYATAALEKGVPLAAVKELLGHAESSDILERVYSHLNQKGAFLSEMAKRATGA